MTQADQSPNHSGACFRLFCQGCSRQIGDCGDSGQYGDWESQKDGTRCEKCLAVFGDYVPSDPTDEPPVQPGGAF